MKTLALFFVSSALSQFALGETITCSKDFTNSPLDPAYQLREVKVTHEPFYGGLDTKYYWGVFRIGRNQSSLELRQFFLPDGSLAYKGYPTRDRQFTLTINRAGTAATGRLELPATRTPSSHDNLVCETADLPRAPAFCSPGGTKELKRLMVSSVVDGEEDGVEQALLCGGNPNWTTAGRCPLLVASLDTSCGSHSVDSLGDFNLKSPEIFNLLLDQGALMDARDPATKETSLHKAVRLNLQNIVENLIAFEADINAQDAKGFTPTMRAAELGDVDMVTSLLEGNPDLTLKNRAALTALDVAKRAGFSKLYALLSADKKTYTINGRDNPNGCDPDIVRLKLNEPSIIVLDATNLPMFKLSSPGLNLDLMAERGSQAKQTFVPARKGEFAFTCGPHGAAANNQTTGKFIVE